MSDQPQPQSNRILVPVPAETIPQSQPTFDKKFFDRATGFMKEQLILVPELEGIAIIPTWAVNQHELPFGITMGRNGPLRGSVELMHMCQQLQGTYEIHLRRLREHLGAYDNHAQQLADTIKARQAELAELDKQITQRKETLGGNPPAS